MNGSSFDPLGTSFAFPLSYDGAGGFAVVSQEVAVEHHLRSIISALLRSHRMEPWFGIVSLPFRPVSHAPAISAHIKRAIIAAEDRIYHDRLIVRAGTSLLDNGVLPIQVIYVVIGQINERTMDGRFRVLKAA